MPHLIPLSLVGRYTLLGSDCLPLRVWRSDCATWGESFEFMTTTKRRSLHSRTADVGSIGGRGLGFDIAQSKRNVDCANAQSCHHEPCVRSFGKPKSELGQTDKYSEGADIFRSYANSRHPLFLFNYYPNMSSCLRMSGSFAPEGVVADRKRKRGSSPSVADSRYEKSDAGRSPACRQTRSRA
jgi:hypothetical protein